MSQPDEFIFTAANQAEAEAIVAKYPNGRKASAVIPLLDLAQRQNDNWLPLAAMEAIAELLEMPKIRVLEVATFYTMFNRDPVGRHFIEVCTTTPCWLRGSADIVRACEEFLGISIGETTEDGQFTLVEVECQGACVNAPMCKIGDDFFEDLDPASVRAILEALRAGEAPKVGSQIGRHSSEPEGGATTLTDVPATNHTQRTE